MTALATNIRPYSPSTNGEHVIMATIPSELENAAREVLGKSPVNVILETVLARVQMDVLVAMTRQVGFHPTLDQLTGYLSEAIQSAWGRWIDPHEQNLAVRVISQSANDYLDNITLHSDASKTIVLPLNDLQLTAIVTLSEEPTGLQQEKFFELKQAALTAAQRDSYRQILRALNQALADSMANLSAQTGLIGLRQAAMAVMARLDAAPVTGQTIPTLQSQEIRQNMVQLEQQLRREISSTQDSGVKAQLLSTLSQLQDMRKADMTPQPVVQPALQAVAASTPTAPQSVAQATTQAPQQAARQASVSSVVPAAATSAVATAALTAAKPVSAVPAAAPQQAMQKPAMAANQQTAPSAASAAVLNTAKPISIAPAVIPANTTQSLQQSAASAPAIVQTQAATVRATPTAPVSATPATSAYTHTVSVAQPMASQGQISVTPSAAIPTLAAVVSVAAVSQNFGAAPAVVANQTVHANTATVATAPAAQSFAAEQTTVHVQSAHSNSTVVFTETVQPQVTETVAAQAAQPAQTAPAQEPTKSETGIIEATKPEPAVQQQVTEQKATEAQTDAPTKVEAQAKEPEAKKVAEPVPSVQAADPAPVSPPVAPPISTLATNDTSSPAEPIKVTSVQAVAPEQQPIAVLANDTVVPPTAQEAQKPAEVQKDAPRGAEQVGGSEREPHDNRREEPRSRYEELRTQERTPEKTNQFQPTGDTQQQQPTTPTHTAPTVVERFTPTFVKEIVKKFKEAAKSLCEDCNGEKACPGCPKTMSMNLAKADMAFKGWAGPK